MHTATAPMHESPRVRLQGIGAYSAARGQDFPPHKHTSWELTYYRWGQVRCPLGVRTYDVAAGSMLLTPPDTVHAEIAVTGYGNYFLAIDAPAAMPWPQLCHDDASHALGATCAALLREQNSAAPGRDRMLALLLAQLRLLIERAACETADERELIVRRAETLIEERYAERLRIEQLAAEVGVAVSTLRSYFGACRGHSPRAALHQVRMRHALGLLRGSTLPLESVARQCGYDSASHLSRSVKAATGTRPTALRR